jgi:TonB-dependent starch-binding outer membrane protein SusC
VGGTRITYDTYYGFQAPRETIDMMTAQEFAVLRREAHRTVDKYPCPEGTDMRGGCPAGDQDIFEPNELAMLESGLSTDWQDLILRRPVSHRQNVTISGGTPTTNYTVSLDHEDTQGIFLRSDNRQTTGRFNVGHSMFEGRLRADVNLVTGLRDYFRGPNYDYAWRQALIRNPTDWVQDDNGAWRNPEAYFYVNPMILLNETTGTHERRNLRLHGTVTLNPIDNLTLSVLSGTTRESRLEGTASTFESLDGFGAGASRWTRSDVDRVFQLTGTYSTRFGRQGFSLLGGYDYQDFLEETFSASNSEFPTDQFGWHQLQSGDAFSDGRGSINSGIQDYKVIGFFGRLNYDWANRYLLTATLRREGNSRFGADHKWGMFPSVSAGWRISDESFMRGVSFVDDLKLRAGYGVTGIAPNFSYLSLESIAYRPNQRFLYEGRWVQTLGPARNPNPDLRWEQKGEINVGLDFALFNSRLFGTVDVYQRNTRDMLFNYSVPSPPFPTGNILANVARMRNSGFETMLSYDVFSRPGLRWTTSLNGSLNSNRLVSLSDDVYQTDDCFNAGHTGEPIQISTHRVCVGERIGNFFGYESVGINEQGEWLILDQDDEVISIRDATSDDSRRSDQQHPHKSSSGISRQRPSGVGTFECAASLPIHAPSAPRPIQVSILNNVFLIVGHYRCARLGCCGMAPRTRSVA